jgi:hypothetical protein
MKYFHYQLVTLSLVLFGSSSVYAGTWMRSEGEGYYSADLSYETASYHWNNNRVRVPMTCDAKNWALGQTYEYGWDYYHTLFGKVDLRDRECGGTSVSGVGDVELGMRGRLNIFRNGRTWEMAAIIPTGYSTTGSSRLGNGLYGFRVGAYGRFTDKDEGEYAAKPVLELGGDVIIWEGSAPEHLHLYAKGTLPVFTQFWVYAGGSGDLTLSNRSQVYDTSSDTYRSYGYDKVSARLGVTTKLGRTWGLSLEARSVLWGRNVSDSNTISLFLKRNIGG